MTRLQLANLLFTDGVKQVGITDSDGCTHMGIVDSIEREDGSGSSFNVTMSSRGHDNKLWKETFHVRTDD